MNDVKTITFELEVDLHREVKTATAIDGKNIKGYVMQLIEEDLANASDEHAESGATAGQENAQTGSDDNA